MESNQTTVNRIGQDFTFTGMIRFVLPTMITQFFLAVFKTVDDGLFVTNYVGTNALSAINIIFPLGMLMGGLAMIFASGGSTVCARKMGEGRQEEAQRSFTSIILMAMLSGALIGGLSLCFQKPLLRLLGATDLLMDDCITYSTLLWIWQPITILCPVFDFFYSAAGKPGMSIVSAVVNGIVNIICDYIFIVRLQLGVQGAALATIIGDTCFSAIGWVFYADKKHEIHFAKLWPHYGKLFREVFSVGMAQFFNHVAMSATSLIQNIVMLRLAGEDGLAAFSIVGYLQYLLGSSMGGFADGVSAIFSYNYGARDKARIKRYFQYACKFLVGISVAVTALCILLARPLISIYVQEAEDPAIFAMVLRGMHISPLCNLFSGFGMFSARFFASMNNGRAAAVISFMRNGIFSIVTLIALPILLGIDGVWLAAPAGELLAFFFILGIYWLNRDNYGNSKSGRALLIDTLD